MTDQELTNGAASGQAATEHAPRGALDLSAPEPPPTPPERSLGAPPVAPLAGPLPSSPERWVPEPSAGRGPSAPERSAPEAPNPPSGAGDVPGTSAGQLGALPASVSPERAAAAPAGSEEVTHEHAPRRDFGPPLTRDDALSPRRYGGQRPDHQAGSGAAPTDAPRASRAPEQSAAAPEGSEEVTHEHAPGRDVGQPPMRDDAPSPQRYGGQRPHQEGRHGGQRPDHAAQRGVDPRRRPAAGPPRQTAEIPSGTEPYRPQQWGQEHQPAHPGFAEQSRSAAPSPGPANWSYMDAIRSSELVPARKIPPRSGWRRILMAGTFGLINLGQSPDERRLAELETTIRSLLRGRYKIGVLGKGGTGKTTLAAAVGSIFAELRQDDRVVAIDADTAFGKLGMRIDPNAKGSYWELAADENLHTFADMRSRVGNNAAGLYVLAGESATGRRRVLDPVIYREATGRLDNHFTISLIDCGSTLDSPVTQEALRDLDALIVVSSPWIDGAATAGQTMDWLASRGYTGLLHRTVLVLNDSDGHADKRTRALIADQFSQRGLIVVELPFDGHLRPGGVVNVQTEIDTTTRRRLIEIAAAIAEHFATTTDGPRARR